MTGYSEETKFYIFQAMAKYGGNFVTKLAEAWFAADQFNKQKLEATFNDYMEDYGPDSVFFKSLSL